MICARPSDRALVMVIAGFAPVPTVGFPVARSGGQSTAQLPLHALLAPESRRNRYSVRPCESTRTCPRLLFATPSVAVRPSAVFGSSDDVLVLPPPPPQPAIASAVTSPAAGPRTAMYLLRAMLAAFPGKVNGSCDEHASARPRSPPGVTRRITGCAPWSVPPLGVNSRRRRAARTVVRRASGKA